MIVQKAHRSVDQADTLRRLMLAPDRTSHSIAIASGKGGVGKTSVAVNLAIALAQRGARVILLDLDLGLANADVLCNLNARRNLSHVVTGVASLEEVILEGPCGIQLVPGASGLKQLADLSEVHRQRILLQLGYLEQCCDFLIMDLGAGISGNVITFACFADISLIVTTPEPTAITDAYSAIKLMVQAQCPSQIEVLVNMAVSRSEAKATYERLAGVASRFLGTAVLWAGYVLSDEQVMLAVRSRTPLMIRSPHSNAAACLRSLAQKYTLQSDLPITDEGFFGKVARLFL